MTEVWKIIDSPASESNQYNPILTYGLSEWMDSQWSIPFTINKSEGKKHEALGDISVLLGFQALNQKPNSYIPNLRITIQEVIPTGRYDGLNPSDKGTGATGAGSYQTVLSLNFEYLAKINDLNYFRPRLSLSYAYALPNKVHGLNVYGGAWIQMVLSNQGNYTVQI